MSQNNSKYCGTCRTSHNVFVFEFFYWQYWWRRMPHHLYFVHRVNISLQSASTHMLLSLSLFAQFILCTYPVFTSADHFYGECQTRWMEEIMCLTRMSILSITNTAYWCFARFSFVSAWQQLTVSVCMSICPCLFICLCLSICHCFCLAVCMSLSLSVSLYVTVSVCLCLCVTVCVQTVIIGHLVAHLIHDNYVYMTEVLSCQWTVIVKL